MHIIVLFCTNVGFYEALLLDDLADCSSTLAANTNRFLISQIIQHCFVY